MTKMSVFYAKTMVYFNPYISSPDFRTNFGIQLSAISSGLQLLTRINEHFYSHGAENTTYNVINKIVRLKIILLISNMIQKFKKINKTFLFVYSN